MTIKPRLRKDKAKKNGECPIAIVYTSKYDETYFSTGRTILPKYWNKDAVNAWVNSDYGEGRDAFNRALKKMVADIQEKVDKFYLEHGTDPTCAQLKKVVVGGKSEEKTFFFLYDTFIQAQSSKGVKSVATGTTNNYRKVLNHINGYAEHRNLPFDFHSFTHAFYNDYIDYLTREKHLSVNSIGADIKILKTFVKWAQLHHKITVDPVVLSNWKLLSERVPKVFLEIPEIDTLLAMNLSDRPILERVRDCFVLQCCIGCRYSDMGIMVKENIRYENGLYRLKMRTKKNKKDIDVPITERAFSILRKYHGQDPKEWIPTMADCNLHIKTVCKLANISDNLQVVKGGGVFRKEWLAKKYELITTHSAPRSFANIMRQQGIDTEIIADIMGKSKRTIEAYLHTNQKEIEQAMIKVWDTPRKNESPEPKSPSGGARE